ncbi:ATP-binding protein [Mycolicibacterium sp. lyk4-40-TYG-92]|uniref:ATP-binding protein n=1 Tax=Mycolicibacterium sp. lyk4-40-TYG-92 TaxID=3040295 RepID=UPI00254FCFDC|nr:ATP-binding protein [Mycolicibacterium sp. lyk4-40-TYG-92]
MPFEVREATLQTHLIPPRALVVFETMAKRTGGTASASGLFYQYLFTLETFLQLIEEGRPDATEIWIEDPADPGCHDPDIVDFSVYDPEGGRPLGVYQAKSVAKPAESKLGIADALPPLIRLVQSIDCPRYVLITNAQSGPLIDRLNAALRSDKSDSELQRELLELAKDSPRASHALTALVDAGVLCRMRRAQVVATGESATVIRTRLIEKIRTWRSKHKLPLGVRGAQVLEHSLITHVFERAAATDTAHHRDTPVRGSRTVTLTEFCEYLAPPEMALSQAAGLIEAGDGIHYVPTGDGVDRPELFTAIVDRFNNIRSARAQMCALVGPSGIGKTRLAAMFAHAEHRTYDRVCWIDAESDASIVASIARQTAIIGLPDPLIGSNADVAAAFLSAIRTFIGRWLIVFDNAPRAAALQQWITSSANADIIVTSHNSVDWTAHDPIEIPRMTQQEARSLLRSRLHDDLGANADEQNRADTALSTLARRLEHHPLALQMAAAHFQTLTTVVDTLDAYLASIEDFADAVFNDDTLDLDDYPRTLLAAINLCLSQLIDAASHDHVSTTALHMLMASAVVASQRIPETLLYAAATFPVETLVGCKGYQPVPDDHIPYINAAVRRLRAQSLVQRAESPSSALPTELQRCLDVNEILQYAVRAHCALDATLNQIALHLSSWLGGYINSQDFAAATALQPHALAILERASRIDGNMRPCALLAGNEAGLLNLQGRTTEALTWLTFEWDLLQELPQPDVRLSAMTAAQLLQAIVHNGAAADQIEPHMIIAINAMEQWAAATDSGRAEGAAHSASLLAVIEVLEYERPDADAPREWRRRIEAAQRAFPTDPYLEAHSTWSGAIERALTAGRYADAQRHLIEQINALAPNDHIGRLRVKAQRIQVLVNADLADREHAEQLTTALKDLAHEFRDHPAIIVGAGAALNNVAINMQTKLVLDEDAPNWLLDEFRTIVRLGNTKWSNMYDRYCNALMTACEATHDHDVAAVASLLQIAADIKPPRLPATVRGQRSNTAMMVPWLQYWLECAQRGLRATAAASGLVFYHRASDTVSFHLGHRPQLIAQLHQRVRADQACRIRLRSDVMGCRRAADVRLAHTDTPLAYILLDDNAFDHLQPHLDPTRLEQNPPRHLAMLAGRPDERPTTGFVTRLRA